MSSLHEHIAKDGFRLRGTHMTRIDGFSDVAYSGWFFFLIGVWGTNNGFISCPRLRRARTLTSPEALHTPPHDAELG